MKNDVTYDLYDERKMLQEKNNNRGGEDKETVLSYRVDRACRVYRVYRVHRAYGAYGKVVKVMVWSHMKAKIEMEE